MKTLISGMNTRLASALLVVALTLPINASAELMNAGLNDAWYYKPTTGQGFFFNIFPDKGTFFLSWFTYDVERPDDSVEAILGEPGHRWLIASGEWEGDTATLDVKLVTGGVFDSAEPAPEEEGGYGTIVVVIHDCASATLTYDIPSLSLMGEIPLKRVVKDNIVLCEELT